MVGVRFHHEAVPGDLLLRLPPTQVDWTFNLNTTTTNTYAGQVVQVLSINFDKLILTGQFGWEGAHGAFREKDTGRIRRRHNADWNTSLPFGVGQLQMTAWFQHYFSAASQGTGKDEAPDTNYREEPVIIKYVGNIDVPVDVNRRETLWKVYPTSFPSYKRSNEDFAPEWKVECDIFEAPGDIRESEMINAIERLRFGDRHSPRNPFSDPEGIYFWENDPGENLNQLETMAREAARKDTTDIFDYYHSFLGEELTSQDMRELIMAEASLPQDVAAKPQEEGRKRGEDRIKEARRRPKVEDELKLYEELGFLNEGQ
jgi:hypothetical protein